MQVLSHPTEPSFQGLQANLEGLIVDVLYSDGTREVVSNVNHFLTIPFIMGAAQVASGGSTVQLMSTAGVAFSTNVVLPAVIPFLAPAGAQITGANTMRQDYFVDEVFDFTGLTAEAVWVDGTVGEIPLGPWTPWAFEVDYDLANNVTNPRVLIDLMGVGLDSNPNGGGVVTLALSNIFTVIDLEFAVEPNFPPFLYSDPDTLAAWRTRSAGVVFRITYTNNATRNVSLEEAFAMNERWFISPTGTANDPSNMPFRIITIQENDPGIPILQINNPRITYFYRGYRLDFTVPVM
jgi:hypothetical protein